MKEIKIQLFSIPLTFILLLVLTGCFSGSDDSYEVTVFTEKPASSDLQERVNQTLETNNLDNFVLSWNLEPPSYMDDFPTIIVKSHDGTFETSSVEEFEEHIQSLD